MKEVKPELVSITYKVGKKYYTATIAEQQKTETKHGVTVTPLDAEEISCGPDCKCVNGVKWRFITWGGLNKWLKQTNLVFNALTF